MKKKPQSIDEYLMNLFIDLLVQVLSMPDEMIALLIQACDDEENRRVELTRLIQERVINKEASRKMGDGKHG